MSAGERQPKVLFAIKEELMLQTIREMLRNYGTGKVQHVRSMEDAYKALYAGNRDWDIFIADGALPNAAAVIRKARPEVGPGVKFLLLMSNPTREEVMEAGEAGVDDFLASPFPSALFEEKLDKLMGRKPRKNSRGTAVVFK